MALDISNISFEGNSNASTNANASTNQNDNQDVSHLDGNGGDNHNLDTKDSQTPNNQQGNAEQNNNKDSGQGATGFHDATKGGDNADSNSGNDKLPEHTDIGYHQRVRQHSQTILHTQERRIHQRNTRLHSTTPHSKPHRPQDYGRQAERKRRKV